MKVLEPIGAAALDESDGFDFRIKRPYFAGDVA